MSTTYTGMKLVVLVALLVCVETAPPARACEPPPPGPPQLTSVLPNDGATGVPTNTQVRLDYDGFEPALQNVEVRPVGGAALTTTTALLGNGVFRQLVVVHLQAPLAPQTQYEVVTDQVVSTFRTGDGADTTPPTFAGLASVTTSVRDCSDSSCCGPNSIAYFDLNWDGASDDFSNAMIRYNVYAGDTLVVPMTGIGAVGFQLCSGDLSGTGPLADFEGGSGKYRVRAVDLAGNEDTNNVTQDVTISCGSGCACVTAGGSPSGLVVPLLLALCGLRSMKTRVRRGRAGSGRLS